MLKLIRYLKQVKWQVLAIVLLLVVQAWCDLSLPQYTSDIVDVGIQQGGIEHAAPDQLRDETMEGLKLFMDEDGWSKVDHAYDLQDGIWYLGKAGESTLEELDEVFGMPMLMLSAAEEQGMDAAAVKTMVESGQMTMEQVEAMAGQAIEKLGAQSDMIVEQRALLFVKEEYAAMGLELNQIQMN